MQIRGTPGEPFAHAIYRLDHKGSQPLYRYSHVQRHPDPSKSFDVEFVNGPLQGKQTFASAIQFCDNLLRVPVGADGKALTGGGKMVQVAEYGRKEIDGVWKMALLRMIEDPDEIERSADVIAEHQLISKLQSYTSDQLVRELVSRPTFFGLILMFPGEGRTPKKGDRFFMGLGQSVSQQDAAIIMRSVLESMPGQ